jgi:ubiquinone/menaquinone biosynthesis C-methylase UbiE
MNTDSTKRFTDRVENYVRYRPGYPDEVVAILAKQFGWRGPQTIADVGCGTGISSELFLRHGHTVIGIEPNAKMREAAESMLASYRQSRKFQSVDGTAEATTLADGSVDGVIACQAFHWFDPAQARDEFARIQKAGGWTALIWNLRKTDSTPFLRAYEQLLLEFGNDDYASIRQGEAKLSRFEQLFRNGFTRHVLPNTQQFDLPGLTGRLLSSSYAPAAGDPKHEPMLRTLAEIFDEFNETGMVEFQYDTEIFAGHVQAEFGVP